VEKVGVGWGACGEGGGGGGGREGVQFYAVNGQNFLIPIWWENNFF